MGMAGPFLMKVGGRLAPVGRTEGSEGLSVARVIEFYIPTKFSKRVKWVPLLQRGKIIEFSVPKKSA
jgi:hypothetical protein